MTTFSSPQLEKRSQGTSHSFVQALEITSHQSHQCGHGSIELSRHLANVFLVPSFNMLVTGGDDTGDSVLFVFLLIWSWHVVWQAFGLDKTITELDTLIMLRSIMIMFQIHQLPRQKHVPILVQQPELQKAKTACTFVMMCFFFGDISGDLNPDESVFLQLDCF